MDDRLISYGPAFMALNERQQQFVLAMASNPFGTQADWARDAGYSDVKEGCKVIACRMLQDERIQAAALEVARGNIGSIGPVLATSVLLRTAADWKHPQQVKAAELILNRVGMHETQELHVKHTDLTGEALMMRLNAVAERLGLDPQKLIGSNLASERQLPGSNLSRDKVIEGKVISSATEVKE